MRPIVMCVCLFFLTHIKMSATFKKAIHTHIEKQNIRIGSDWRVIIVGTTFQNSVYSFYPDLRKCTCDVCKRSTEADTYYSYFLNASIIPGFVSSAHVIAKLQVLKKNGKTAITFDLNSVFTRSSSSWGTRHFTQLKNVNTKAVLHDTGAISLCVKIYQIDTKEDRLRAMSLIMDHLGLTSTKRSFDQEVDAMRKSNHVLEETIEILNANLDEKDKIIEDLKKEKTNKRKRDTQSNNNVAQKEPVTIDGALTHLDAVIGTLSNADDMQNLSFQLSKRTTQIAQKLTEMRTCTICLTKLSNITLVPCGHVCLCGDCSKGYTAPTCPICRTNIEKKITNFVA
jgi:hypothetical protein